MYVVVYPGTYEPVKGTVVYRFNVRGCTIQGQYEPT